MKKKLYGLLSIIQIVLVLAAYLVQDLSMKRMGMMRHVVFTNQKWEKAYPVEGMIYGFVFATIVLSVILVHRYFKNKKMIKGIETILVTGSLVFFTLLNSTDTLRAYYFILLIGGLIMILQYIKQLIDLKKTDSF